MGLGAEWGRGREVGDGFESGHWEGTTYQPWLAFGSDIPRIGDVDS